MKWAPTYTTVRSVAEEVGISHGNLCYHFKNTDVLIEALYDRLIRNRGASWQVSTAKGGTYDIIQSTEATFRLLYKYRFLLLDFCVSFAG